MSFLLTLERYVALDRYQPAIDFEQILALRADSSLAAPVLASWAEDRAGAAPLFATALGRCDAYPDVDGQLRELADREIARLGLVQAWHGKVTAGESDRYRDGRVITERLAHHAMMLPQLLELPHRPWRGTIKGPKTAVEEETLRPLVLWVAEQLGDAADGRMARWTDLAPRLTPANHESGGSGRRLMVDPLDATLVIGERLPWPVLTAAVVGTNEVIGPVLRDPDALMELQARLLEAERQHARVTDTARAARLLKARGDTADIAARHLETWKEVVMHR